jgi:subtilisin-like proprotein convertase family protein
MPQVYSSVSPRRRMSLSRWLLGGSVALLMMAPPVGYSRPGASSNDPGLKLGLIDRTPLAGASSVVLEEAVAQVRHDYGRFLLARLTTEQEEALRAAGYGVRIFENPDRVGLGPYSFRVPPGPVNLPPDLTADESRAQVGTFLVKLIGPVRDEWLSQVRTLGVEILTPIPEFTYLVRIPPRERARLAALPFVDWVGPYHPAFKLSSELVRRYGEGSLSSESLKLNVLVYRSGDVPAVVNRIEAMRGEILHRTPSDFYDVVTVRAPASLVPDLARIPEVYAIETAPEPRLEDESSTQILAGQVDAGGIPFRPLFGDPTYTDWLNARTLSGANVTIGYVDNGVMNVDPTGHTSGRVNESVCGTTGSDGHGQFGASNAGGACSHTGEGNTGYRFGLGVAPSVNFINIPWLKTSGACSHDDPTRARDTVTNNGPNGFPGRIQNNSWGAGGFSSTGSDAENVSYQSTERTFDILVRDADSVAAGNQPLITCFSAGNEGNTTPGDLADSPASLTRPHAAKNILTIGSSSVYRPSAGGTNINDRSFFSSQGPAFDGRIKPDFMAPGGVAGNFVGIASAMVNNFGSSLGDGLHSLSAGTSFASPQTAGGAALLVEWWQRFASAVPSPAMVKALLVNSARDMQGGNTADFIPNRHEGWGRWNLGNILEPGTPTIVSAPPLFRKTSGLGAFYLDQGVVFNNNGDQYQVRFVPSNPAQPMKATLVWTDAPGAVASCPSLVNNLDLELVQNGNILLRGNAITDGNSVAGGPADSINNVEQVIQPSPSGFYTLTVRAVTLAGDGIPGNADSTDQDFALVVTNAVIYSGPILSAGTPSFSDVCSGTGSGGNTVIDPGETLVFSLPLANSGGATATGVSGSLVSQTAGVTVLDGNSSYADIPAGATGPPNAGDTLSVVVADNVPCGTPISLVLNVTTGQGSFPVPVSFQVGSKTVTTQDLTGTTGLVNDDVANFSAFTTPAAASGTIRSVTMDLNISSNDVSFLYDDYTVNLASPQGTGVPVHNGPIPCSAMSGNYPNTRLAQIGSMNQYQGQDAGGIWTLRVADRNNSQCSSHGQKPCSQATVNSWFLHITREGAPACNTCTVTAPPEVSAPASPTPLLLSRDAGTGVVTFTWENQGALSDSYRLYQGLISSLVGTGVTTANTAPVQCAILAASTSFVPVDGNLFFLVAGQKGSVTGPLGQATDPVTYPRSAGQTCP